MTTAHVRDCSCGRSYDEDAWRALPLVGYQRYDAEGETDEELRVRLRTEWDVLHQLRGDLDQFDADSRVQWTTARTIVCGDSQELDKLAKQWGMKRTQSRELYEFRNCTCNSTLTRLLDLACLRCGIEAKHGSCACLGGSCGMRDCGACRSRERAVDGGGELVRRYQRCVLRIWALFEKDLLPADDPAQMWVERLEGLIAACSRRGRR